MSLQYLGGAKEQFPQRQHEAFWHCTRHSSGKTLALKFHEALVKPVSFWSEAEEVLCQSMSKSGRWHCGLVAGGREAIGGPYSMQACLDLSFPMAPSLKLRSSLPALPPHRLAPPAHMEGL